MKDLPIVPLFSGAPGAWEPPSHRNGFHSLGDGKTVGSWCSTYDAAETRIFGGKGGEPAIDIGFLGVTRGSGLRSRSRRVSITIE